MLDKIKGQYIMPEDFLKFYSKLDDIERRSLVYHYIMDNTPYAFNDVYERPLLFEQVKQYIAHVLNIDINHIKLIGSSKTGFRMDQKDYGIQYSKDRDLDFMIIDDKLFMDLVSEFEIWKKAYIDRSDLKPKNETERSYWDENIQRTLPFEIKLGFIDTKFMPNRQNHLPLNSNINNTMSNVTSYLKTKYGFTSKGASVRIYKNIDSFYCQQCRNIDAIIMNRTIN